MLGRAACRRLLSVQRRSIATAVVFPGQGYQRLGMLEEFQQAFPDIIDPVLAELDDSLDANWSEALTSYDWKNDVNKTSNAQPLLLTASYAIFRAFDEMYGLGSDYKYFLGHSLGEYTALVAAGVLSFRDAVWMVRQRGKAMEAATNAFHAQSGKETAMTTVMFGSGDQAEIRSVLSRLAKESADVDVGNINSQKQLVLSGVKDTIKEIVDHASKQTGARLRTRDLNVSGPFHSRIMAHGQSTMEKILAGSMGREVQINWPPKVPVISNITARPFESVDEVKNNIVNTLVETVQWSDSLQYAQSQGVRQILSVGPGKIGKNTESELPDTKTVYLTEPDSLDDLLNGEQ